MRVVPFTRGGDVWDGFVTRAPGATFCHLYGWRDVMADALGHESPYAVAVDDQDEIQGVLPLVRVKSPWLGHYLVSLPFLNYGGPVGEPDACRALAAWAAAEARTSGADLLELRTRAALDTPLRASLRKITVLLDLPADPEELWRTFSSKLRNQVRRPQRESDIEVRFGLGELDSFYHVFAHNMRDLGTPVLPRTLFEAIARAFPDLVVFGTVWCGGRPVAGGCGFLWGGEFEMTWASSLRSHNHLGANMLLYWSFMREVIARRARIFNFGRCTPGGGTHRFKRQWGGSRDVPLPWAQWAPGAVAATPSPDRPVFQFASAVWRRLPLALANLLGPILARQLP
jgi:FemAB-related protein (PEP-CTERM system-associated)